MKSHKLKVIPKEDIKECWDELRPFFESSNKTSEMSDYSVDDMLDLLTAGDWIAVGFFNESGALDGALSFSLHQVFSKKIAFITEISGDGLVSEKNWDQLKKILGSRKVDKVQALSRESAARLWHRLGFKEKAFLVEAEV